MSQRTFNFTIAFLPGWSRPPRSAPPAFIAIYRGPLQLTIVVLTALILIFYAKWRSFREFVRSLPIKVLILLHVTRVLGVYFLLLHREGKLPWAFAVPGGVGDIVIAATALGIICLPLGTPFGRRAALVWNTLGLIDILCVVTTAAVLGMRDPMSMMALTIPPLVLLPTFLVPVIIASHVILFERLMSVRIERGHAEREGAFEPPD